MKNVLLFLATAVTFFLAMLGVLSFWVPFIVFVVSVAIIAVTSTRPEVVVEPHRYDY